MLYTIGLFVLLNIANMMFVSFTVYNGPDNISSIGGFIREDAAVILSIVSVTTIFLYHAILFKAQNFRFAMPSVGVLAVLALIFGGGVFLAAPQYDVIHLANAEKYAQPMALLAYAAFLLISKYFKLGELGKPVLLLMLVVINMLVFALSIGSDFYLQYFTASLAAISFLPSRINQPEKSISNE